MVERTRRIRDYSAGVNTQIERTMRQMHHRPDFELFHYCILLR